jgi:hypothetical protein
MIGMAFTDEISWSILDFVVMGLLLASLGAAINFIRNRTKNLKNRILCIGIVIFLFTLIWLELAVGVF